MCNVMDNTGGYYGNTARIDAYGVRPVVSLSNNVEINIGDGSYNSPYQVKLSS